ncbi:MAG TPA: hypothetical protein VM146_07460 [Steroidobacteraceae bacterium]|nr:hypothetical protein [Steroidobacteraceae bacterium]
MAEPQIPDRSAEPAVQESLDRGPRSTTAANTNDVARDAPPDTRDDEGNLVDAEATPEAAPDAASDRAADTPAESAGTAPRPKTPPMEIREIENIEDDAKGG